MNRYESLPAPALTAYADLLAALLRAPVSARGVSYFTRTVDGRAYWYLQYVIGSNKKSHYLGPASEDLNRLVTRARATVAADEDERAVRERLVSTGIAAGLTTVSASEGRVYEALVQSALFEGGATLVGTHAFIALGNQLGVRWQAGNRTEDIDIGHDPNIKLAAIDPGDTLEAILRRAEKGFFPVPAMNRDSPSTSFKIRGKALTVSLLTPARGPEPVPLVRLEHLGVAAEPVRFLEYLIEGAQPAAVPYASGLLVRVPDSARFALHKLVVSQRRPQWQAGKARKDIEQAAAMISCLAQFRPGDLRSALAESERMPAKFGAQLREAIALLPEDARAALP
jgi:hypothetical protein